MNRRTFVSGFALGGVATLMGTPSAAGRPVTTCPPARNMKALTFDIIGTVFDWLGSFSAGVVPLAQKYGLSIDLATFAKGAVDGYGDGVDAVLKGGPWVPPDEILRDSITSLLLSAAGHAPSANEVDDFFALWRTLNPWPGVPLALSPCWRDSAEWVVVGVVSRFERYPFSRNTDPRCVGRLPDRWRRRGSVAGPASTSPSSKRRPRRRA